MKYYKPPASKNYQTSVLLLRTRSSYSGRISPFTPMVTCLNETSLPESAIADLTKVTNPKQHGTSMIATVIDLILSKMRK